LIFFNKKEIDMNKHTVQSIILDKLDKLENKIDILIPVVEGLKVKAAIAGGMAGIVGTAVVSMILTAMK